MSSTKTWEKVVDLPTDAGNFVDMANFNGTLFVAMQGGIFQLIDEELVPIAEQSVPDTMEPDNG